MELAQSALDDGVLFRVSGDMDFADVSALEAEFKRVTKENCRHIFLDLGDCTGIVSTVIGLLVGWRCEKKLADAEFGVICPSPPVQSLLSSLDIDHELVHPARNEAELNQALRAAVQE